MFLMFLNLKGAAGEVMIKMPSKIAALQVTIPLLSIMRAVRAGGDRGGNQYAKWPTEFLSFTLSVLELDS